MSFISGIENFFKAFGHDVTNVTTIAKPLMPFIGMIPGIGPEVTTVFNAIVSVENLIGGGNGAQKKAVVTTIVNTVSPGLDQAQLSSSIDGIVTAINLLMTAITKVPTQAQGVPSVPSK